MAELDLEAGLAALLERAATALHDAVAEGPFARSQELVPVETSALKDSGRVSDAVIEGDTVTVVASYGNADDATGIYAIVVHERLDVQHPSGGQSKYLEAAQLEAATDFAAQVAAKMK